VESGTPKAASELKGHAKVERAVSIEVLPDHSLTADFELSPETLLAEASCARSVLEKGLECIRFGDSRRRRT
jgi:hypothetical protein